MNIKILDSWLRDHLKTNASAKQIAETMSLSSISIERVEKVGADHLYDIEVTTNRPDLASVVGIAREAAAVLPHYGHEAEFVKPKLQIPKYDLKEKISIENDKELANRVLAVVMEVSVKKSPAKISERLEASGIRSLNNVIDITNYVMRTIGHPTHVFDFDRLNTKTLKIRESRKGEVATTLDDKTYVLNGGDIIAVDDDNRIVDLLGVMGLKNSVVTDETKRILFFIDNNDPHHIRKTSMGLGIRTEAAQLNEKAIDPEIALDALLFGINLFEELASGKVISEIIDIYPNKPHTKTVTVSLQKINDVIGVEIPHKTSQSILKNLGFEVEQVGDKLKVTTPSFRAHDIHIPEDIIEEIARVYGYHNLPSSLPSSQSITPSKYDDEFFWERTIKSALKLWGFIEVYSYSMVAEELYDGPTDEAVTIKNPLNEEFVFMRSSLILSLLKIVAENKQSESISIFELANVYKKRSDDLPSEAKTLSGVIKKQNVSFFMVKGIVEQIALVLGITKLTFVALDENTGSSVFLKNKKVGVIEILETGLLDFELNFDLLLEHATLKKIYTPLAKFPPIVEDMRFEVGENIKTDDIIEQIYEQSKLIKSVTLLDRYESLRTFHLVFQDKSKNLTTEDVEPIRKKIISEVERSFKAKLK